MGRLRYIDNYPGFVHYDLDTPPKAGYTNLTWPSTSDIDFAGNNASNVIRVGTEQ